MKLLKMNIGFKRDSKELPGQVEETLKKIASPEFYEIKIEISAKRIKGKLIDKIPVLGGVFKNIFGSDLDAAIESGIDFPQLLSDFKIEVEDSDKKKHSVDILDRYEREEIKISKDSLEQIESLKETLIEKLTTKIDERKTR